MSEKEKFAARLNTALDEAGFPDYGKGRQSRIAELLNESVATVSSWLDGREYPRTSMLVKLARMANVRSNWLLSGTGEMLFDEQAEKEYCEQLKERRAEKKRMAMKLESVRGHEFKQGLSREALLLACDYMKLSLGAQKEVQALMAKLSSADADS